MKQPSPDRPAKRAGVALFALIGLTVLSASLILLLELFLPPVIGLANNADFANVMGFSGFQFLTDKPEEKYRDYVVTEFALVPGQPQPDGYRTSELLLADAARFLAPAVSPPGRFDIRILAAVHVLLLLAGIALLAAAARPAPWAARAVVAALCVFFFTDVAYAAPFNSFYGQTASLLFLLLTAGVAALAISRGGLSGLLLPLYFLAAALFVVSKPQEGVQGPLLACLGVLLAAPPRIGRPRARPRRIAVALGAALIALSFAYFRAIPRGAIHNVGLFHSVFKDLLPQSPDPARDLAELGLDPSLLRYSGMHAYMPGAPLSEPLFQRQFFDRLGYGRLGLFYLRHPARFFDRIRRAAPAASRMRPALGNYEKKSGFPPRTVTTKFAWWSVLKWQTRPFALAFFSALFAATLAACAIGFRKAGPRERLFRIALAGLLALALTEFLVCAFGDFLADLSRHLYSFHAMVDLILIADLAWIAQRVSARAVRGPVESPPA